MVAFTFAALTLVWALAIATANGGQSCEERYEQARKIVEDVDRVGIPRARRAIGALSMTCSDLLKKQQIDGLTKTVFQKQVEYSVSKYAVHMVHFSKSGGTSFCKAAMAAGCAIPDGQTDKCWCSNCLDGPQWMDIKEEEKKYAHRYWVDDGLQRHARYDSCAARAQMVLREGVTMFSNENFLIGGTRGPQRVGLCDHFLNVLVVREPISRTVSHLFQIGQAHYSTEPINWENAEKQYHRVVDNYMVRSLMGEKVFRQPMGTITEEHLESALKILDEFDVILPVSILEDETDRLDVLNFGIGWQLDHADAKRVLSGRRQGWGANTTALPQEDIEKLKTTNILDRRLFDRATQLANLDLMYYRNLAGTQISSNWRCRLSCGFICQA